jgi:hypothetical protein
VTFPVAFESAASPDAITPCKGQFDDRFCMKKGAYLVVCPRSLRRTLIEDESIK